MAATYTDKLRADAYLTSVLNKYALPTGILAPVYWVESRCEKIAQHWAGNHLNFTSSSGSYAKGTAVKGHSDFDLFISLKTTAPGTLKEIYESLFQLLLALKLNPKKQNVSVRITLNHHPVDLVPGRLQNSFTQDHSLHKDKQNTWCQTNIAKHISIIKQSGCIDIMRLTKIWRNVHGLDFPSFYLELSVMKALEVYSSWSIADRFVAVLQYLAQFLESTLVIDPASSGNWISDDLTHGEKLKVASCAERCLRKNRFEDIVW